MLGAEFDARGIDIDRGRMYRTLRRLEVYGWVQSRWFRPDRGPRRRLYRVTPSGRRALSELVGLIAAIHEAHDELVLAYERPHSQRQCVAARTEPTSRTARRPGRRLLSAWLLLLLGEGESYGYGLGHRLADQRLSLDPAALYRTLRTLEDDGCVASRWGEPVGGPRRRLYALTSDGRHQLDELVRQLRGVRECMGELLLAHRRAVVQHPSAAAPSRDPN